MLKWPEKKLSHVTKLLSWHHCILLPKIHNYYHYFTKKQKLLLHSFWATNATKVHHQPFTLVSKKERYCSRCEYLSASAPVDFYGK